MPDNNSGTLPTDQQGWYERLQQNWNNRPGISNYIPYNFTQTGVNQAAHLGSGSLLTRLGLSNLGDILSNQGRTDPAMFNRQIADIQRGTQGQQSAIQQQGAQAGLQGSGVMAALQAATGQAGEDRVATAYASESATAEQRRRSDLELLRSLLIDPSIDFTAIGMGQYGGERDRQQRGDAADDQAIAGIIGAIISAFCWVAREVYGPTDPRWLFFRHYVVYDSPSWFFRLYARYGERVAEWIRSAPIVKPFIKPFFDRMVKRVFKEACDAR